MNRLQPLVVALALALPARALLDASEVPSVITWPAASPAPLSVGKRDIIFDQVPVTVTEFTGAGVRITSDSNGDWISTGEHQPRYSLVLRSFENRDVMLAFSIYPRTEFLSDLETPTWHAYVAGIRARYGASLVSLEEGSGGFYFFGGPYREVIYTFRVSAEETPRMRREIFGLAGDRLIIATTEGDAGILPLLKLATDQFLARLNLAD
jgi:hypothetical protein